MPRSTALTMMALTVFKDNRVSVQTACIALHRCTFSEIMERLDPSEFLRVHRRAMVRRSRCQVLRVVGDGSYQLGLLGGDSVPVSERYVGDVRKVLLARG